MSRTYRKHYSHHRGWVHEDTRVEFINRRLDEHYRYCLLYLQTGCRSLSYIERCAKRPIEEVIAEAEADWALYTRDGRHGLTNTSCNSGFKYDAKKMLRRANKKLCRSIMKYEYEDDPHPIRRDAKTYIWDWY